MAADPDDDALTWDDGDADPTHVGGTRDERAAVNGPPVEAPGDGSVLLVVYGVLAGGYLLATVGWLVAALRDRVQTGTALFDTMYLVGQLLAVAAPPLWFAAVLALTRDRRALVRVGWLALGLIPVLPWPTVFAGVAA